ncbi:MAG: acetyltransferase [Bacteroidia bacterium]|nr:acetyltransferase [Bacteroidia bacterium]NNC86184.1 acetyltransferase [Bacteroidia bacterium]
MTRIDKPIFIFGTGGFGRETLSCLLDVFENEKREADGQIFFLVSDKLYDEKEILGFKVYPASKFTPSMGRVVVAIGEPKIRKDIVESLPENTDYTSIIHPSAKVSRWTEIGKGSIITAGCILTCQIKLGKHAHLNLNSTIGHDCNIGDFFTTAPATNISGKCDIGEKVYFGTGAMVKQGITICNDVIIGMGGVVLKNISDPGVYIGSPVKKLVRK